MGEKTTEPVRGSGVPASGRPPGRVLLTGWFSFPDGEATAGDVLAWRAVHEELERSGIAHDTAWSPAFEPDALSLDAAVPAEYTHLVFVCGPVHGAQLGWLTNRFANCRRIAVGVSVIDSDDPVVKGFDVLIPRDMPGLRPRVDLSARSALALPGLPVIGVLLTSGQGEYGAARRHAAVCDAITGWLVSAGVAALPLETRLDRSDWTLAQRPEQFISILRRLDAVVTMRLHGLVLALAGGVPAVAVDPVAAGGKVSAQAEALGWPALVRADEATPSVLAGKLDWCLSTAGRERAGAVAARLNTPDGWAVELLAHLRGELDTRPAD
jgi:hypothetical protein